MNSCFCDNGTDAKGVSCKVDGDHTCNNNSCNTGHILKGNPPTCYEPALSSDDDTGTPIEANCPHSKNGSDGKPINIELPCRSFIDSSINSIRKNIYTLWT